MRSFAAVTAWLVCFAILNVMVKGLSDRWSAGGFAAAVVRMVQSPVIYFAGALYLICALLYFYALGRLPLSIAGPTFNILGVVTTSVLGFTVFNETLSSTKLAGIVVCLLGTILIFYSTPK